ncbi:hypothetical protein V5E97_02400 [Singulisphaera sp. Ch08]|uniref:Uncharacterized protein n=1 Tax=Singulisphaera sp. Ch08 TaxID=3120278 RepID=A0AAU7CIA0_9BACT
MRRSLCILLVGLAANVSQAGIMYYDQGPILPGGNIQAVTDTGQAPTRLVIGRSEFGVDSMISLQMTRFNHSGSNGQALLVCHAASGDNNLHLVYRPAANAGILSRPVTALPYGVNLATSRIGQDDSFFSLTYRDYRDRANGQYSIWRLNVSVDQALAPNYAPPTSFGDPRLQLIVDSPSGGDPQLVQGHGHTWSPDGTRIAYNHMWRNVDGTYLSSLRVKSVVSGVPGDPSSDMDVRLYDRPGGNQYYEWSPVSDQILNQFSDGPGIQAFYADRPGVRTVILTMRTTETKTQVVEERALQPRWRPDGLKIGVIYTKFTTTKKTGAVTGVKFPGVISPSGWPVTTLGSFQGGDHPLGWAP